MNFVKTHFLNMLKGIGIGIANVIPGFSGGTMAVMLKIYDLFVYSFANIFNDFKFFPGGDAIISTPVFK